MEPVHKDIFYPMFNRLTAFERTKLKEFLNVKNLVKSFSLDYISYERFEKLDNFIQISQNNGFSSIKEYIEYDAVQQIIYLQKLNEYMISKEFTSIKKKLNKNKIIEQQKLIYKTVKENENYN